MTVLARTLMEAGQIPTGLTTQYTTPANTRTIIDKMTATNATGTAALLSVYIVPSGGAAASTNKVLSQQSVSANGTYLCPEAVGHILNPGDAIVTESSAAAINMRISGREVS